MRLRGPATEEDLERIGVENVRWALLSNTQISNLERDRIWAWLRRKDEKRRASDLCYARWTVAAAIIAAMASVLALFHL